MELSDALVSVGLPVRNGERTLENVVKSVLAQDHEHLELVITDNASSDNTEQLCRDLAQSDSRIVYYRHARDVGILNNFLEAMRLANGMFFRWISDDDWLAPQYVSRCLKRFAEDHRLILVTTQLKYIEPNGETRIHSCEATNLASSDPAARFVEVLRLLNGMTIDPLYGLMRRQQVAAIPRRNMIREDEVFATKLALAGPWGHVPEVLAHRQLKRQRLPVLARRLGVPPWQAYLSTSLECREMLRWVKHVELTPSQRRRARYAVAKMFLRRQQLEMTRRCRKLLRLAVGVFLPQRGTVPR